MPKLKIQYLMINMTFFIELQLDKEHYQRAESQMIERYDQDEEP